MNADANLMQRLSRSEVYADCQKAFGDAIRVPGIVQQSGGHIVVHSLPGIGTTFKIYLPAVGELAKQPLQSPPVKPVRSSKTILLVEDEAPVKEVLDRT